MTASLLTIAVVARNAESTIGRAVGSARQAGQSPILLIDDGSSDQTCHVAKAAGGDHIRIFQLEQGGFVGKARQTALEHIKTPYAVWLDADDAIEESRLSHFSALLHREKADLVYGTGVLVDGGTGTVLKALDIPDFMKSPEGLARNFERNWLPLLHCGFKTEFARKIGYDTTFSCVEDYDFFLRALAAGGTIMCTNDRGYQYYHYDGSISRNLDITRAHVKRALAKHNPKHVQRLLKATGLPPEEQIVIFASNMLYQENYKTVIEQCAGLEGCPQILPQYERQVSWISQFLTASALCGLSRWQEAGELLVKLNASRLPQSAEVLNNLAVCYYNTGKQTEALTLWQKAVSVKPNYRDAHQNLSGFSKGGGHVTSHPVRSENTRDKYQIS